MITSHCGQEFLDHGLVCGLPSGPPHCLGPKAPTVSSPWLTLDSVSLALRPVLWVAPQSSSSHSFARPSTRQFVDPARAWPTTGTLLNWRCNAPEASQAGFVQLWSDLPAQGKSHLGYGISSAIWSCQPGSHPAGNHKGHWKQLLGAHATHTSPVLMLMIVGRETHSEGTVGL